MTVRRLRLALLVDVHSHFCVSTRRVHIDDEVLAGDSEQLAAELLARAEGGNATRRRRRALEDLQAALLQYWRQCIICAVGVERYGFRVEVVPSEGLRNSASNAKSRTDLAISRSVVISFVAPCGNRPSEQMICGSAGASSSS